MSRLFDESPSVRATWVAMAEAMGAQALVLDRAEEHWWLLPDETAVPKPEEEVEFALVENTTMFDVDARASQLLGLAGMGSLSHLPSTTRGHDVARDSHPASLRRDGALGEVAAHRHDTPGREIDLERPGLAALLEVNFVGARWRHVGDERGRSRQGCPPRARPWPVGWRRCRAVLAARKARTELAVQELRAWFASLPVGFPEGAQSEQSSYEHLLVIQLEFQGLKSLVGDERARATFTFWEGDHYRALYRIVRENREEVSRILVRNELLPPAAPAQVSPRAGLASGQASTARRPGSSTRWCVGEDEARHHALTGRPVGWCPAACSGSGCRQPSWSGPVDVMAAKSSHGPSSR